MIYLVELQMQGNKHLNVNSGLLRILSNTFGAKNVVFFCDSVHRIKISELLPKDSEVGYKTFRNIGTFEMKKSFMFFKIIRELILAISIFRKAKLNKVEMVFFASAFPFTAISLNLLSSLFNQKIVIALHGDIGILTVTKNKLTTNIYKWANLAFFLIRKKNTGLIFYGETIKQNLFSIFPKFKTHFTITIDHPYNYTVEDANCELKNKPITFANIGTGLMNKNSHYFYQLAKYFEDDIKEGKVRFLQIGNISSEVLSYSNELVEMLSANEFIPTKLFEDNIKGADYFVYFFSKNSYYDLCPSGTFFDAIKYGKPIISLSNDFFEYYFNKIGDIGYLSNDLSEMKSSVLRAVENHGLALHTQQKLNLAQGKETLSLENIFNSFRLQYEKL